MRVKMGGVTIELPAGSSFRVDADGVLHVERPQDAERLPPVVVPQVVYDPIPVGPGTLETRPLPPKRRWHPLADLATVAEAIREGSIQASGKLPLPCPRISFNSGERDRYEAILPIVWEVIEHGHWWTPARVAHYLREPIPTRPQGGSGPMTDYDRICYILSRLRMQRSVAARPSGRNWHYAEPIWAADHPEAPLWSNGEETH